MRPTLLARAAVAVLALVALPAAPALADTPAAPAASRHPFAPMDVFQFEWASDPQVSPDGRSVAYVRQSMDVMKDHVRGDLWLLDVHSGAQRPITSGQVSAASPRWSPDGARLLYVSEGDHGSQVFVRWTDSGATAQVTHLTESPGGLAWSPDGKLIAFTQRVPEDVPPLVTLPAKPEGAEWADPPKVIRKITWRVNDAGYVKDGFTQVFVVPADGGAPRQVTSGSFNHGGTPEWTPDGRALIVSVNRHDDWERHPVDDDLFEVSVADGTLRQLTHRDGPDESPAVSPDGHWIAYTGFDDRKQGYQITRLYLVPRGGGEPHELPTGLDLDVVGPRWMADSKHLVASVDDHGQTRLVVISLDGHVRNLVEHLGGLSLDRPYASGSFSLSRAGVVAFTSDSPNRHADVSVVSLAGGPARRLTVLEDAFAAQRDLATVEEITCKSSWDGHALQGWLVVPAGLDRTVKHPLVLEIHGGPFAAYGPHFSADDQLYASAGYVVLFMNPRGSTSYGEAFGNAIHHAYPGRDFDDLMSGVDAALARGFIDPQRLFVTGGSGGGVLTAWIVGTTDRFRAAVVQKPVINWASFVLTCDEANYYPEYWFGEEPWEKPEDYFARSPLSRVGHVTTPTMLLTGEEDYTTPIAESEQFYEALRLRGVDTALVRVPGASHSLGARPSNLMAKPLHVLAWFASHGGLPVPASH